MNKHKRRLPSRAARRKRRVHRRTMKAIGRVHIAPGYTREANGRFAGWDIIPG